MGTLTHHSYGKSDVRLTRVVRKGSRHELFEITAAVWLEGDFSAAYNCGDNRNCIATDTMKNFVYVKAKEHPFSDIETFAMRLAGEFVKTYPQVSQASIELFQTAWRRIDVDGAAHDHAFVDAGRQKRYAKAVQTRENSTAAAAAAPKLIGGVRDLVVLKTTASEWKDFHTDRHRTLADTSDRIMATSIDADWEYPRPAGLPFDAHYDAITGAILRAFASKHSLGVQQTLKDMGDAALAACAAIDSISFSLPNLHRIPFNFAPFGLTFENDIFIATTEPFGLISGTISRGG